MEHRSMADIHIERPHAMPLKKAREAADRFAEQLAEKFDLESEWDGDILHFSRPGVSGTLALGRHEVAIKARLGLLLSAFKSTFEQHIHDNLDRVFGATTAPAKKAPKKRT
jgi:putative polyhydroxyalkanoate system protein